MVLAPKLPPMISRFFSPFTSLFLPLSRFCRTGLPVMMILSAGKKRSMPSYATQIFAALLRRILLVTPAKPFCSCSRIGIPIFDACHIAAPEAYPPTPTPTSGRKSLMIFFTCRSDLTKSAMTDTFFHGCARLKPRTGRPTISYPACGTRSISIRPSAPTNKIFASGSNSFSALAILTAGNICPPVPPPEIKYLIAVFCYFVNKLP